MTPSPRRTRGPTGSAGRGRRRHSRRGLRGARRPSAGLAGRCNVAHFARSIHFSNESDPMSDTARDPEGRFTVTVPPGWSAAPDDDQDGLEVWKEDGAGTLHLISFAPG